jgi:methylated-DNA-protein-cysteine methyltransferase-like protein
MNSYERIYSIVKQIPRGSVSTYGRIAALSGNPRLSRVVGYALHVNPDPGSIPCHRVVNRFGGTAPGFVFGGEGAQRRLLEREGVAFGEDGRIDLREFGWPDGGAAAGRRGL